MCKTVIHVNFVYNKERSKRPHQSKRAGALKSQKHAKNGANAQGRLDFFILLKNALGTLQTYPGRSFSCFYERKTPWGEPTTREGVRKGPAAEAESDASQHAVDGIARVYFFLFIFIDQFKLFFLLLSLDQWTQHDQINKAKRCRGGKQLQKRRQTRSKSYGTWRQQVKRPRQGLGETRRALVGGFDEAAEPACGGQVF